MDRTKPQPAVMPAKSARRAAAALAVLGGLGILAAAEPAMGGRRAPAPEAADQTLGMAIMSASADADGTLLGSAGVARLEKSGVVYIVDFARSIVGCARVANIGLPTAQVASGSITTSGDSEVPNRLYVTPREADGTLAAKPFHLIVFCPK